MCFVLALKTDAELQHSILDSIELQSCCMGLTAETMYLVLVIHSDRDVCIIKCCQEQVGRCSKKVVVLFPIPACLFCDYYQTSFEY